MTATDPNQLPTRLVRFQVLNAQPDAPVLWGEPVDRDLDIGKALVKSPGSIQMRIWGKYDTDIKQVVATDEIVLLGTALNPVHRSRDEVKSPKEGLAPCLMPEPSYRDRHAPAPHYRMPDLSLCPDPTTFIPVLGDDEEMHLETQLVVVGAKEGENILDEDAIDHILGYSVAVTARIRKVGQPIDSGLKWDGIDAFCPLGPVLVSPAALPDPDELVMTVTINDKEVKTKPQGTSLAGIKGSVAGSSEVNPWNSRSYIMIGTPAGAVRDRDPSFILRKGDKVVFHVSHGIGSLINTICEKRGRWVTGENNVPPA